jgi:hypothetical protein
MLARSVTAWHRVIWAGTFSIALLAGVAVPARAQGASTPPPVEDFFENNAFGGAQLSPSGRHLAMRTSYKGRRDFLAVIDLDTTATTSTSAPGCAA